MSETFSSAACVQTEAADQLRRRALSPHYEEFLAWAWSEVDPEDVPHFTELRNRPVELGAWERTVIKRSGSTPRSDEDRSLSLLTEGVAIQIKYLELLDRFDHGPLPPPDELPDFLEGLVTDLAVGFAVAAELQSDIDRAIEKGDLVQAKNVSTFRAKVVQSVSALKERVGSSETEEAERRARRLVTLPPPKTEAPADEPRLQEEEPDAPSWATYGDRQKAEELPPWLSEAPSKAPAAPAEAERREQPRSRLKPLLIVLAVLIVAYGFVIIPLVTRPGPVELTLDQFSQIEVVQSLTARPPSLYVVLDGPRWRAATPGEQLEWLGAMGSIADAAGYTGILVRESDGTTVAEWMKATGPRLIARPKQAS